MLTIGEFSNLCKVSTKTLRYYAEIELIFPNQINPENGYRYYSVEQLETMLFINRLKAYNFSLEEIKKLMHKEMSDEKLYSALLEKKKELTRQAQEVALTLNQIQADLSSLQQGKSMMAYLDEIDVQYVDVPKMTLLFIRKKIQQAQFKEEYPLCFKALLYQVESQHLTLMAPPMVMFHSDAYDDSGLDTEFAIPVLEVINGTRDFYPGLCLKTILKGSYLNLPAVYAKQMEWAEKEGYEASDALYEVYVVDPSSVNSESELLTEIYLPIKKKQSNKGEIKK